MEQRGGQIVFVGSWVADHGQLHIPPYCVAKAGLRMLCQTMALHYAPHGIRVNEIAPGIVEAGLSAQLLRTDEQLADKCRQIIPINQMLSAEDVAWHVAHLCDPRSRHMTGSVLVADGGLSLVTATGKRSINKS
jgi:NAD(P)-dependent dehydrogenase (short-subunit alcohol dehydrogenase family)